jgi:diketogulonate reductase-like aldo/keto reductase
MNLSIESTVELNNGVKMPQLGFGTWKIKGKSVLKPLTWALEEGFRHIDTATLYGNEKYVGKAIKVSEIPREEIFITSKVWDTDQGFEKTQKAFEKSLKKLNLDYLDLYLIHWPRELRNETWRALEKIYDEGKARAIGVANFWNHHIKEIFKNFETIPAVNQVELHPFVYNEDKELIKLCREKKIQVEAYSPLVHGKKLNHPKLKSIAEKYNKSTAQILIRWSLQHGFVCIPKSGDKAHIKENANVFDFEISEKDMEEINSIGEHFRNLYDTSTWD